VGCAGGWQLHHHTGRAHPGGFGFLSSDSERFFMGGEGGGACRMQANGKPADGGGLRLALAGLAMCILGVERWARKLVVGCPPTRPPTRPPQMTPGGRWWLGPPPNIIFGLTVVSQVRGRSPSSPPYPALAAQPSTPTPAEARAAWLPASRYNPPLLPTSGLCPTLSAVLRLWLQVHHRPQRRPPAPLPHPAERRVLR
jgi:hypothetical protein